MMTTTSNVIDDKIVTCPDMLTDALGLLPAHGRMVRFSGKNEKRAAMLKAADDFEKETAWFTDY